MENKTMANEILSYGRKNLYSLHRDFGFDFEKPFDIFRLEESFTIGQIKKILTANGYSPVNSFNAVLLNRCEWGIENYLTVVALDYKWEDFVISFGCNHGREFHHFSTKSDFNKARKCTKSEWRHSKYGIRDYKTDVTYHGGIAYVVVQKNEFHVQAKKKTDDLHDIVTNPRYKTPIINPFDRYKVIRHSDGGRSYDIAKVEDPRFEIGYYSSVDEYAFDKSGYCVSARRAQLKEKVKENREKREHDAYAAIDTTAFVIAIDSAVENAKKRLSSMFNSAKSYNDFRGFRDAFDGWHGFYDTLSEIDEFKGKLARKEFKSITECTNSFNWIIKCLCSCTER